MTSSSLTPSRSIHLAIFAIFSASTVYCIWKSRRLRAKKLSLSLQNPNPSFSSMPRKGKIIFVSQTGTSKTLAERLLDILSASSLEFDLVDAKDYEPEDFPKETTILIVASTREDGKAPPGARFFANWIEESAEDFRVGKLVLSGCRFAVFGVGSGAYGERFNAVGRSFVKQLRALGGVEVLGLGEGDVDGGEVDGVFEGWSRKLVEVLKGQVEENGVLENGIVSESDGDEYFDSDEEGDEEKSTDAIVDLEDIAGKGPSRRSNGVSAEVKVNGDVNR